MIAVCTICTKCSHILRKSISMNLPCEWAASVRGLAPVARMMLIKTLLLISLLVGVALSCSPVSKSHHNNPYNRLFDDLFGDYNPQVIPLVRPPQDAADNSSALSLGLSLSVLNMDLDKGRGHLEKFRNLDHLDHFTQRGRDVLYDAKLQRNVIISYIRH